MSVQTGTVAVRTGSGRRVQAADRVKSGAAQRAYARRRTRAEQLDGTADLPVSAGSATAGRIPFVTAIIGLLGCGLALTLLLTTRAAEDSYQLGDARAVNRKLADERSALQREVAGADSAPELAARARELGMIPAVDPARLVLGPHGEVTVIGTPTPAQGAPAPLLNTPPTTSPVPAPGHAQAQGERVVPVRPGETTTTTPAPAPAGAQLAPNVLAAPAPAPQPHENAPSPVPAAANPPGGPLVDAHAGLPGAAAGPQGGHPENPENPSAAADPEAAGGPPTTVDGGLR
ncbi:hypothetical protein ACWEVD_31515 [Nocardia thailandica]